jgi:phytol kinase
VTGVLAALAGNTWAAIAVALIGFLVLLGSVQLFARATGARPETTRKMFHCGSGVLTLAFPFLFHEMWPVLLLTGASALLVLGIKFLPAFRSRLGHVANRVERTTLGEVYFPIAIAWLFWLTRGSDPLLFVIPVLMLTFADAASAIIGIRYGMTRYVGASKSFEGSITFLVVGFLCVHVPLLLWSSVGRTESLLIAATLALLVMLLEGSAWRGLDNLFIPIGGFFLLRAFLPLDAAALLPRLLVTVGLVVLIVSARTKTTLEDDSLVAGAFLSYLAWALMGWQWLIGPLAILAGYRWLSPPTPENSRRMHSVPVMLSIWAAAILWLTVANAIGDRAMLFPYTVVFAAHLAMFGTTRLASQFRSTSMPLLFGQAVVTAWAIVMVPYVLATGLGRANLASAGGAIGAIAIGTAIFVSTEPSIRNAAQTTRRWLYQAVAAGIASGAAWAIHAAASEWITP